MESDVVDGQDVRAVYAAAGKLIERARRGEGPGFLLANTYRFTGHHVGDIARDYYRSKQEEQKWKSERDPVKLFCDWLLAQGVADQAALDKIHAEVKSKIDAAVQFAIAAPYPSVDKVTEDVYA